MVQQQPAQNPKYAASADNMFEKNKAQYGGAQSLGQTAVGGVAAK